MKFFAALSDAEFARAAFTAAGLDFDALKTAKNNECIKAALSAVKPVDGLAEAEKAITAAVKENGELKEQVVGLETAATRFAASFKAIGIEDTSSDEKIAEQHKLNVAKAARDMVARAGHPGILEEVDAKSTVSKTAKKVDNSNLKGADRVRADFEAQMHKRARNVGES